MATKKISNQPEPQTVFTTNFNRPWHPSVIENGSAIMDWHGDVVVRIETKNKTGQAVQETRRLVVSAVNAFEAAMRVVNLMALMKHTCEKREGGRTVTVHECARCLAEVAQARAEER